MNFYCPYCQQRCHKKLWDSEWVYCNPCKIRYQDHRPDFIVLSVELNGKLYELHSYPNKTEVVQVLDDGDYLPFDEKKIIKLDYPIASVTPQNVAEKLKTLLVFS